MKVNINYELTYEFYLKSFLSIVCYKSTADESNHSNSSNILATYQGVLSKFLFILTKNVDRN